MRPCCLLYLREKTCALNPARVDGVLISPELSMRGRGVEGKPEMECCSHARLTFHPDLPVVRIHYVLHDLGAEPSAALLGADRLG